MPYADPQKRKEAAKLRAKKSRLNKKTLQLQGLAEAPRPTPRTGPRRAPSSTAAPPSSPAEPEVIPGHEEWARRKVRLGLAWVKRAEELQDYNPVSAFQIGKAGVDLVNANLSLLPENRENGARAGSIAAVDAQLLQDDAIYRDLAEQMLIRKLEIELAQSE